MSHQAGSPATRYRSRETKQQCQGDDVSIEKSERKNRNRCTKQSVDDVRTVSLKENAATCNTLQDGESESASDYTMATESISNRNNKIMCNNEGANPVGGENTFVEENGRRVGPCSKQMLAIHRMITYLEIVTESGGNNNNSNDDDETKEYRSVLDQLVRTTTECTELHHMGLSGYDHLPGAIFERIVNRIDGTMFLRVYQDSKTYNHPRLNEIRNQENMFG